MNGSGYDLCCFSANQSSFLMFLSLNIIPVLLQPLFEESIRRRVMKVLTNGQEVQLKPYKINVYGPGGFFTEHVDTPIDPVAMIGTVVVCLPSEHKGTLKMMSGFSMNCVGPLVLLEVSRKRLVLLEGRLGNS